MINKFFTGFHTSVVHTLAGDAEKVPDFYVYRFTDGKRFDFVCNPTIHNISNNVGSLKGQIINIRGYGFSENITDVKVVAQGVPCKVLETSLYEISCEVQESPQLPVESNYTIAGKNKGFSTIYRFI